MKKNNYVNKSKNFFNKTANKKYGNANKLDDFILKKLKFNKIYSILDLGCGDGRILEKIRILNSKTLLFGLDISEEMLKLAKEKKIKKCNLILGNCEELPYEDESMELILCLNSFHHYPNPKMVIKEMKRILKLNGKIIIGDIYTLPIIRHIINLYLPYSKSGDYKMYSQKKLNNLFLDEGFNNLNFSMISPWLFISEYENRTQKSKE